MRRLIFAFAVVSLPMASLMAQQTRGGAPRAPQPAGFNWQQYLTAADAPALQNMNVSVPE